MIFRLSLVIFLLHFQAFSFKTYDSIAFTVNGRPVTLSDVKAYYYLDTGHKFHRDVPVEFLAKVINIEKVYEIASGYSVLELNEKKFKTAVYLFQDFYNIDITESELLLDKELSKGIVLKVLKKFLMVNNFLTAHTKEEDLTSGKDVLESAVKNTDIEFEIVNYLY